MNKYISVHSLVLCIVLTFTTATNAQNQTQHENQVFHHLYHQQIVDSHQLVELVADYQQNWPTPLAKDNLFSSQRQTAFYRIFRLLAIAIDANLNIDELQSYGVTMHGRNSYLIALSQFQHWVDTMQLFNYLKQATDLKQHQRLMLQAGLTQTSIDKIETFLTTQPLEQQLKQHKKQVKDRIYHQALKRNWTPLETGYQLTEAIRLSVYQNTNLWAESLVNQINPSQQQLFINYLYQQLNYLGIAKSPVTSEQLEKIGQQLLSAKREIKE